jgi:RNA polymerase sigma factor (sigma-70 family)
MVNIFLDEENLISLLKQKDQTAFKELVHQFSSKVYNTALGILQHAEDAEDVSQEVFIEVFQSIQQFKGESKLSTWIYRITVSKSLEFIRKKNRKKRFAFVQSLFGLESVLPEKDKAHFYHPGVLLENKERAAILFQAIDKLPENQKTAFILHKIENLSYAEITEVMMISLSSVESLMFRAKQNLQKLLSAYYEENEK